MQILLQCVLKGEHVDETSVKSSSYQDTPLIKQEEISDVVEITNLNYLSAIGGNQELNYYVRKNIT